MFTGIIEETGQVLINRSGRIVIRADLTLTDTRIGNSIAVNGVCLTVTDRSTTTFDCDLSPETIKRTNLGTLLPEDVVNLERPLSYGARVGGHLVQGHVDGTAQLDSMTTEKASHLFSFTTSSNLSRYLVEKGYITIDGISLTIVSRDSTAFTVAVIPYTYAHTTLRSNTLGSSVNIEIDILAKYAEALLKRLPGEI
jgi:riboflavin synthase